MFVVFDVQDPFALDSFSSGMGSLASVSERVKMMSSCSVNWVRAGGNEEGDVDSCMAISQSLSWSSWSTIVSEGT